MAEITREGLDQARAPAHAVAAEPQQTAHGAFAAVGDDTDVAAVVVDAGGLIIEATAAAAAMLGFSHAALAGRSLQSLGAEGWHWAVSNALLRLASGSSEPFNLLLLGRSGRQSFVQMIPRPRLRQFGSDSQHLLVWREQRRQSRSGPVSPSEAELRRLAYALLESHEGERLRVASDLHDGVAPLVITAKFFIEGALARLKSGEPQEAAALMEGTVARLRDVLSEVRRITVELRPSSLQDLGLLPTITWYCRDFGQARPPLNVACDVRVSEAMVPAELKLQIFRILQEALNNVGRHAGATEARVSLLASGDELSLRVEDNGVGFDAERVLHGDVCLVGVGLHSISKRVDATHGRLVIHSRPGHGASLIVSWPLPTAA